MTTKNRVMLFKIRRAWTNRIAMLTVLIGVAGLITVAGQTQSRVLTRGIEPNQRFSRMSSSLKAHRLGTRASPSLTPGASVALGGLFQAAPQYPVGAGAGALAIGDFNGDGKDDVVALGQGGEGGAIVLLNNGDGTFQIPSVDYPTGWGPEAVAVGDFNGDGKLDIAVVAEGTLAGFSSASTPGISSVVSILLGKGDGTFQPHIDFPIPINPLGVAVGDFNGDGKLDLAVVALGVAHQVDGTSPAVLSILLGNGDGTFEPHVDYDSGVAESVAVGDFNGDGKTDLVVNNFDSNTVGVFLGRGDGTFQQHQDYATGAGPVSVAVGDFNGDNKPDLAVATNNGTNNTVSVLIGNGDGTFRTHVDYVAGSGGGGAAIGNGSNLIIARDLNADGKVDVAMVNSADNSISLLFGKGDGTLQPHVDFGTGGSAVSVVVGDFDGDGTPDLATGGGTVSVLLNKGGGTFRAIEEFATGLGPGAIVVADLNGDGIPDLATANGACFDGDRCSPSQTVTVLLGNGDGTYRAGTDYPTGNYPQSLAVGDFNADGRLDIVTANHDDDTVSVLLGNGDGTFRPRTDYATASFPFSVAVGDFNADGKLDLAVATAGSGVVSVLLGNGDGTFRAHMDYATALPVVALAVGDFNGDGKLDLVATGPNDAFASSSGQVSVLLGKGDGTFQAHTDYPVGRALAVAVADLDGDGKDDVVVANGGLSCVALPFGGARCNIDDTVSVLLGNGDGTFDQAVNFQTGSGPRSVAIGDLDGDGKKDIAVTNAGLDDNNFAEASSASVLWGKGDGTFRTHLDIDVGPAPFAVAVADLNSDLKEDLAVALAGGSGAVALLNTQTQPENILSVTVGGTDPGATVSNPAGIDCGGGGACAAGLDPGSTVTLTPVPPGDYGSVFGGWSGDCAGMGACVLDLNLDRSVTVTFNANPTTFALTVVKSGSGTGEVGISQDLGQLACAGNTCSASLFSGTVIHVGAIGDPGSIFTGWISSGCKTTQIDCVVTLSSDLTLTATFNGTPPPPDFSLSPASASLTVQPGGQVTDAMTLAPKNGTFASVIQLTCTVKGAAPAPTCSLNPTSVTPGANSATSTLTITAPASTMQLRSSRPELSKSLYAVLLPLMFGIAVVGGSKTKRRRYSMFCGFLLVLLVLQMACGGSGGGTQSPTNYTVTVTGTATSGTIQHTTQVTVTVQ